jgi:hypothetical protein
MPLEAQDLWNLLVGARAELAAFAPAMPQTRYRHLETELQVNPRLMAGHALIAAQRMPHESANTWLRDLLTGRPGIVAEAHAYGVLAERHIPFEPHIEVQNADLFRVPGGPVVLDGRFPAPEILFDIKSLFCPGDVLGSLTDQVNEALAPHDLVAVPFGLADFDQQGLAGHSFGNALAAVIAAARLGTSFAVEAIGVRYRFVSASSPYWFSEQSFQPYRFAAMNRHLPLTDAKQVPRARKFVFVYVYSELDHELASFPGDSDIGERALARRVFVELTERVELASRYCRESDAGALVRDIARSIGAMLFVQILQRQNRATCRMYLNPNANAAQRISTGNVEEITDFNDSSFDSVEDFEFDNY